MTTLTIERPVLSRWMLRLREPAATDVLRVIHDMSEDAEAPDFVRRMAGYIHAYLFDSGLDFDGIIAAAKSPDLDTETIAERFAKCTGSPPMALVDNARCDVARKLIGDDDLSIEQVARLVGFRNYFELFRVVRLGPQSPERRVAIARHRVAGATDLDVNPVLLGLAEALSGPAFHRLIAGMLEGLPTSDEAE